MTWTKYLVTTAFLVLGVGAYVPDAEAITAISACTAITTSGSYILTRNLVAAGNCLVVTADFVTTDLAGHTISGNGTGGGITTGSDVGITVRGGFVTNFFNGIDLISARDAIVERVPSRPTRTSGSGYPKPRSSRTAWRRTPGTPGSAWAVAAWSRRRFRVRT